MRKKIIILSASTGGGHNKAAMAIKNEIEEHNINGEKIECEIIDSLKLVNIVVDKVISKGYEKSAMYTPKAYGKAYKLSETHLMSHTFNDSPLISIMARKLKKLIINHNPDLIIGTHPFPMMALSNLKKHYKNNNKINIPTMVSILTDYTTHSTWIQDEIDYYISAHELIKEILISEGISCKKIKSFGIPIEKSFFNSRDKNIVLEELSLNPSKFTVLLMGGSFGSGNIKETLENLIDIKRDFQILVITGRNESLQESLSKKFSDNENKEIKILGYVKNMNEILSSIDVLITKPGGLTTTEALLKEVPMIVPYYIPGQEEENLDFLTNNGCAIRVTKKFTLDVILKDIIDNPSRIRNIKNNIKATKKENSAENISNFIVEILKNPQ